MDIRARELLRFIFNLIFALYHCVLGLTSRSWWFIAVGAYYMILSMMRMAVIIFSARRRKNELFAMKFSGAMIFALSVVLCGIVYLTTAQYGALKHHEITMITIALYAFIKITLAIRGFITSEKNTAHM